jgi:hypothetical protein
MFLQGNQPWRPLGVAPSSKLQTENAEKILALDRGDILVYN